MALALPAPRDTMRLGLLALLGSWLLAAVPGRPQVPAPGSQSVRDGLLGAAAREGAVPPELGGAGSPDVLPAVPAGVSAG